MKIRILFISIFIFLNAASCSRPEKSAADTETGPASEDLHLYAGIYELLPAENVRYVIIKKTGIFFYQTTDGRELLRGFAETDSDSLRLIVLNDAGRRSLQGIFLKNDYHPDAWTGFWENNVRYLRRLRALND